MNAPSPSTRAPLWPALAVVAAAIAVGAAATFFLIGKEDGGSPAKAQRPELFMSPTGDDGGHCTASRPCASLDRALHVAKPGQLIEIAAGDYGEQLLTADPGRSAKAHRVLVRPKPRAKVRLRGISCGKDSGDFGASAVDIGRITTGDVNIQRCDRLVLRNVTIAGGIFLNGSTNFSMIGGSVGPGVDYHPDIQAVYRSNPAIVPTNVLFDGVHFHDWTLKTPGTHIECLQVSDVHGFTLRNSRFTNCDTFDVHIDGTNAGPVRDVLIEGNSFAATGDHTNGSTPAYYGFSMRDGEHVMIRNNRAAQAFAMPAADEPIVGWTLEGNRAPLGDWQCDDRIVYKRNRWDGAQCGSSDAPTSGR
jgi:hypothetical protein